jgi:hypothetical protein
MNVPRVYEEIRSIYSEMYGFIPRILVKSFVVLAASFIFKIKLHNMNASSVSISLVGLFIACECGRCAASRAGAGGVQ